MKFVIDNPYHNEYDVKLHWETRVKILRIVGWTLITVTSGIVGVMVVNSRQNDNQK
jgi:hypothetical protein